MGSKCLGLKGFLFGHKFRYWDLVGNHVYLNHCARCGMPKGGWKD